MSVNINGVTYYGRMTPDGVSFSNLHTCFECVKENGYGCQCQKHFKKCDSEHITTSTSTFQIDNILYSIEINVFISDNYLEKIYEISVNETNKISQENKITNHTFHTSYEKEGEFLSFIDKYRKYISSTFLSEQVKFWDKINNFDCIKYKN